MEENQTQENAVTPEVTPAAPAKKWNTKTIIIAALTAIVVLVLAILIMSSNPCKVHRLSKFTNKVEQAYTSYSASDLEKAEAKYQKIVNKLDKCELNGRQEKKVNTLKGECRGYFTQADARIILQDFQNALNEAGDEVKGAVQSLQDNE